MDYKIRLDNLNKYLVSHDWLSERIDDLLCKVSKTIGGVSYKFIIPNTENLEDYPFRINKFFKALCKIENKEISEFITEINNVGFDILRIRFKSQETEDGNFPLPEFSTAVENIKNLIKYVACSEFQEKSQYKRPFDGATDLMENSQVGQSEEGSYVFIVKIPTDEKFLDDIDRDNEKMIDLGRKTMSRLLAGINEAKELEIENEENFKETYSKKLNKNVCEAISNLLYDEAFDSKFNVELSVEWDASNPPSETLPNNSQIDSDVFHQKFKKMAAYLQKIPESEDTTIKGRIQIMKNPEDEYATEKRVIVITDNRIYKNVYVMLNERDYKRACDAHKDKKEVQIKGFLNRKTAHWFLNNPTEFRVI